MNEPTLSPPPPPPPVDGGAGPGLPWEERARYGAAPGFIETAKLFITAPSEAFARAKRRGDLFSPLAFAVVLGWLGAILQSLWSLAFGSSWIAFLPPEVREQAGLAFAAQGFGLVLQIVFAPIFVLVGLFVASGIVHLMLMLVGGTKASEAGFEGTLRAASYSQIAQIASIVPFAGGLIAFVWTIVLETIGLASLHRTSHGKAIAAILLPLLLCCVCVVFAFGGIVALIAGAAASGN